jgi:acetyl-CoA acetyltransferase
VLAHTQIAAHLRCRRRRRRRHRCRRRCLPRLAHAQVAPTDATALALRRCGLVLADIEYHEINEAFAVVALANMKLQGLDAARVNVNGGAIALGHPLG